MRDIIPNFLETCENFCMTQYPAYEAMFGNFINNGREWLLMKDKRKVRSGVKQSMLHIYLNV